MSGTLTDWGREEILGHYFIRDVYTAIPPGLWVAYCRSIPVRNSDVTQLDEPTAGYGRAPIGALTSTDWAFSGFAEVYNLNVVTFPAPTADWGLMMGYAILDIDTVGAGNVLAVGPIMEPNVISNGDPAPNIPVAAVVIGLYD